MNPGRRRPVGALAINERQGDQVRLGAGLGDGGGRARTSAAGVRLSVLGGADARPVCGLRGGPGRRQLGGGLGGVVRLGGRGAAGGAVGVQFPRRRVGVHPARVGLERPGGRGPEPGRAWSDSVGLRSAGFDPSGADGLFGPRTRAAIRRCSRPVAGVRRGISTVRAAEALRSAGRVGPAVAAKSRRPHRRRPWPRRSRRICSGNRS